MTEREMQYKLRYLKAKAREVQKDIEINHLSGRIMQAKKSLAELKSIPEFGEFMAKYKARQPQITASGFGLRDPWDFL